MKKLSDILHDSRQSELPRELAVFCREGLQELIQAGYPDAIPLGGKSSCLPKTAPPDCADHYALNDGKLFGSFRIGKRKLFLLPIMVTREVNPSDIPFETYKRELLIGLAQVIETAEVACHKDSACGYSSPLGKTF